jgi:hypothetical protein
MYYFHKYKAVFYHKEFHYTTAEQKCSLTGIGPNI